MKMQEKVLIGRVEFVDFPELGLASVPAKVDTGAYTSSIHCQDIFESKEGGKKRLHFRPLDPSYSHFPDEDIIVEHYSRRRIKNSFGHYETRFIIKTNLVLGGRKVETELSLGDRAKLRYPVLLGRRVLSKGFVIDVCKKNVADKKVAIQVERPVKRKRIKK